MSIIKLSVPTVSGTMSANRNGAKIFVARGQQADVVMTGYLGGPREKGEDGKYRSTAFGRLPIEAAIAGEGDKQRYVLSIAGGLRGVLFKSRQKEGDNVPDYHGNIDLEDGNIMPLFGRKMKNDGGEFIALSSKEAEAQDASHSASGAAPAPAQTPSEEDMNGLEDGDIPF